MSDYVKDTREHQDGWRDGHASRDAEVAELRAEVERVRARVDHRERDYRECAEQRLDAQAEVEQLRAQLARVTEERDGAMGRAVRMERELETYREEAEKDARVLLPAMYPGEHHDRAIARIIAERDEARANAERFRISMYAVEESCIRADRDRDQARRELDAVRERVRKLAQEATEDSLPAVVDAGALLDIIDGGDS